MRARISLSVAASISLARALTASRIGLSRPSSRSFESTSRERNPKTIAGGGLAPESGGVPDHQDAEGKRGEHNPEEGTYRPAGRIHFRILHRCSVPSRATQRCAPVDAFLWCVRNDCAALVRAMQLQCHRRVRFSLVGTVETGPVWCSSQKSISSAVADSLPKSAPTDSPR